MKKARSLPAMHVDQGIVDAIFESLSIAVWIVDQGLTLRWAKIPASMPRLQGKCVVGGKCFEQVLGKRRPCAVCAAQEALRTGEPQRIETRFGRPSRHYLLTATPVKVGRAGKTLRVIETLQDITVHRHAEEELKRLNAFNKAIIDNAPVAIFTIDREGQFTSVNPTLAEVSGLGPRASEKLIGFSWLKNPYTIKCGLANHIQRGLEGEPFQLWDFPFLTYRGDRTQTIDFKGVPLKDKKGKVEGLLCIIDETTDRVRTRAQLMQEAKMAAIGRLTAGVAHELNNPLATLAAYSELARELMDKGASPGAVLDLEELDTYLEVIEEQTFRCKTIIKDLLDLSRREGFEVVEVDVNSTLDEVLRLIDFRKMKIRVKKTLTEGLPRVKADPSALKQVFLNVINNAIDAVGDTSRASIDLRTSLAEGRVQIECRDNGMGIPDAIADNIFEPFFTTKESGKGIGLGLALCYELLDKMGGRIEAESKPGQGSVFRISLPVQGEAA